MRIARDGTWFYEGAPIQRPALVKLFSSILKLEDGKYFLVTPAEKVGITVDDAPFVAVDFEVEGHGEAQILTFKTHVDDIVVANPENPLRFGIDPRTEEPSPYIHVRSGLEALIDRKSFYRLVDIAAHHENAFGVWSSGRFFPMADSAGLE